MPIHAYVQSLGFNGLTEWALATGRKPATVTAWASGRNRISDDEAARIAKESAKSPHPVTRANCWDIAQTRFDASHDSKSATR